MTGPEALAPSVLVDRVAKHFSVPHEQRNTLKERGLYPLKRSGVHRFEALNDVSFAAPQGESFGVVGRNGSGKSTLLKCVAGIYRRDGGQIYVSGRMDVHLHRARSPSSRSSST